MRPGATGGFPEGRLNEHDEGGLKIAIYHKDGQVFMDFGKAVKWLAVGPEQARELAKILTEQALRVERDHQ